MMKKFSELSKKDHTVESSTNKKDFIKNLVEETLKVVDGEIVGKDTLVKTLNKIVEMNDSKTKIKVLESVKINAYRGGFDFNLITKAIEDEKARLNNPLEEEKEERDIYFAQPNDRIVSVSESKDEEIEEELEEVEEELEELEEVEELEKEVEEEKEESEKMADMAEDLEDMADELKDMAKDEEEESEETEEELEEELEELEESKKEKDEDCVEEKDEEKCEDCDDDEDDMEDKKVKESTRYKLKSGRLFDVKSDGTIIDTETGEEANDIELEQLEEAVEVKIDEVIKESKKDKITTKDEFVEYGKKLLKKAHGKDYDDLTATEMLNGIYNDKIYGKVEDWGEAVGILQNSLKESKEDSAIEEVSSIVTEEMREMSSLSSIYENILQEHHLETKREKIKFILDNEKLDKEGGLKRKRELENMSDKEIDKVYTKLEIDLGLTD
jgi:hypothetical protein